MRGGAAGAGAGVAGAGTGGGGGERSDRVQNGGIAEDRLGACASILNLWGLGTRRGPFITASPFQFAGFPYRSAAVVLHVSERLCTVKNRPFYREIVDSR